MIAPIIAGRADMQMDHIDLESALNIADEALPDVLRLAEDDPLLSVRERIAIEKACATIADLSRDYPNRRFRTPTSERITA